MTVISGLALIFLLTTLLQLTMSIPFYDDYFLPQSDSEYSHQGSQNKMMVQEDGDTEAAEKPTGYTCSLCVVVDEEFSIAYNINDPKALKNSIQQFVDHASWVFRSTDWNNNGKPDNIGFKAIKISYGWKPYKHETSTHYNTPKPANQLLKIFARLNFSNCCLGIGFTNRAFTHGLDGISFGASDRLLGGICDHRNPREDFMTNMNVVLISGRGINSSQLSSYHVAKALLHELGHAFGVHAHDNEYNDPQCWGFKSTDGSPRLNSIPRDGRYIMWGKSPQTSSPVMLKKNTLRFSTCSKASVMNIVSKRKNRQKCFELDFNPYCGNGIVEAMEMCDCGNAYECSQQKCCGSRKSERPCLSDPKVCGTAGRRNNVVQVSSSSRPFVPPLFLLVYFIFTSIEK